MSWLFPWNWRSKPSREDVLQQEKSQLEKTLQELRENRVPLPMPWRDVGEDFFSRQKKQNLMNFINELKFPEHCQNINLLMLGYTCSGKSSFANTLKTVFRDNGKLADPAAVYGHNWRSVTRKLHEVTLKTYESGKKIRLYDCRGIAPEESEVLEKDLHFVIDGHVMKDYEFKEKESISKENKKFRDNPTISDKMHCVLFVTKATDDEKEPATLNRMKDYLGLQNVPIRLILTAMDQVDLYELKAVRSIFHSKDAKVKAERAKQKFGLHDHQVLPIANYVEGINQDIYRDVLALQAVENILQETLVFLEDNE